MTQESLQSAIFRIDLTFYLQKKYQELDFFEVNLLAIEIHELLKDCPEKIEELKAIIA